MRARGIIAGLLVLTSVALLGATNAPAAARQTGFRSVEVFVDSYGQPLAAYQLEVSAAVGTIRIVGIEGGAHAAFAEPPFYDPKAIQQERVILAAFSTRPAEELPKGRTRVATIHFQSIGPKPPEVQVKLQTAATPAGRSIQAEVEIVNQEASP